MAVVLASPHADGEAPFFPPDAAIRRVHADGILVLGGARALLMQLAHPAVARAVAEHSSYRADRVGRLLRTLRATLALIYGTREQTRAAAARINGLHAGVSGDGYHAFDPELLIWVFATLIDTTLEMRERFIGPLAPDEAVEYYDNARVLGELLCIPWSEIPSDIEALRTYVREMCGSLEVTDEARAIARDLFAPLPRTGPAMFLVRQLTSGLLDPALRDGFGLGWGPWRDRQLRLLQTASRIVLPRLPMRLRRTPSFLLPPA